MIVPKEIYFKKRGNSADYKIARLVGAGKIVTDNNTVYRVGETLPEDEFDRLIDWLTRTTGEVVREGTPLSQVPSTPRIEVSIK